MERAVLLALEGSSSWSLTSTAVFLVLAGLAVIYFWNLFEMKTKLKKILPINKTNRENNIAGIKAAKSDMARGFQNSENYRRAMMVILDTESGLSRIRQIFEHPEEHHSYYDVELVSQFREKVGDMYYNVRKADRLLHASIDLKDVEENTFARLEPLCEKAADSQLILVRGLSSASLHKVVNESSEKVLEAKYSDEKCFETMSEYITSSRQQLERMSTLLKSPPEEPFYFKKVYNELTSKDVKNWYEKKLDLSSLAKTTCMVGFEWLGGDI